MSTLPTTENRAKRRWRGVFEYSAITGMAAVGATALAGLIVPSGQEQIIDIVQARVAASPQEQTIGHALSATLGKNILVRCAEPTKKRGQEQLDVYGVTHGTTQLLPESIRIQPRLCTTLMKLAGRNTLFPPEIYPGEGDLGKVAAAAWVTAHEGGHAELGDNDNESDASCIGQQIVDDLAREIGASQEVSLQIQEAAMGIWKTRELEPYVMLGQQYGPTPDCIDEGILDMLPGIDNRHEFPTQQ